MSVRRSGSDQIQSALTPPVYTRDLCKEGFHAKVGPSPGLATLGSGAKPDLPVLRHNLQTHPYAMTRLKLGNLPL